MLTRRLGRRRATLALLATSAALAVACSGGGRYVWYTSLPRTEWGSLNPEYIIGVGDLLTVKVYEQEALSGQHRVRSDGRLAVPLIGELVAAGKQPSAKPVSITVLGEVKSGGTITLDPPSLMLQALAKVGGLTEFADDDRIFVIRQTPAFRRIRFTYEAILNNENGAAGFMLRTGDVIVVE